LRGRIVGGLHRVDMGLAAIALDAEPALSHGREMRAAPHERDILARLREHRAESAADAAGSDDRDAHFILPRLIPCRATQGFAGALAPPSPTRVKGAQKIGCA
jgi:hypothetical protein